MHRTRLVVATEWICTLGAALFLALTAVTIEQPNTATFLIASSPTTVVVGLGLIAIALVGRLLRTGRLTPRTPFDLPMLLFLLSALIGWRCAYYSEPGLLKLFFLTSAVAVFYLLADTSATGAKRFAVGFLAAAVVLAAVYAIQHDHATEVINVVALREIGDWLNRTFPSTSVRLYLPNANVIAAVLALAAPVNTAMLAKALRELQGRRYRSVGWLAATVALLLALLTLALALLLTNSAGAWGAIVAAGLLWLLLHAASWIGRQIGLGQRARGALQTGLGSAAVLVLLSAYGLALAKAGSLQALDGGATFANRAVLFRNVWHLGRNYAFTGAGLGMFQMIYSTYSLLIPVGFLPHAHQWFLEVWIEQGLPGIISVVWLTLAAFRYIVRTSRKNQPREWFQSAGAWSLAVLLLHGLVDAPLYGSRSTVLLLVPFGLILASQAQDSAGSAQGAPAKQVEESHSAGRFLGIVVLLALASGLFFCRESVLASLSANLGAVEQARAELGDYSWPEWQFQDEIRRQTDLTAAVERFETALSYAPRDATANTRLGMIALARGDYEGALRHLEKAYSSRAHDNTTRQLLGEALITNGRVDEGAVLWKSVSQDQHQLVTRLWWYEYIEDDQRAEWIREALRLVNGPAM